MYRARKNSVLFARLQFDGVIVWLVHIRFPPTTHRIALPTTFMTDSHDSGVDTSGSIDPYRISNGMIVHVFLRMFWTNYSVKMETRPVLSTSDEACRLNFFSF